MELCGEVRLRSGLWFYSIEAHQGPSIPTPFWRCRLRSTNSQRGIPPSQILFKKLPYGPMSWDEIRMMGLAPSYRAIGVRGGSISLRYADRLEICFRMASDHERVEFSSTDGRTGCLPLKGGLLDARDEEILAAVAPTTVLRLRREHLN